MASNAPKAGQQGWQKSDKGKTVPTAKPATLVHPPGYALPLNTSKPSYNDVYKTFNSLGKPQAEKLPVGSVVKSSGPNRVHKVSENNWHSNSPESPMTGVSDWNVQSHLDDGSWTHELGVVINPPTRPTLLPRPEETFRADPFNPKTYGTLPIGTTLAVNNNHSNREYTKTDDNEWVSNKDSAGRRYTQEDHDLAYGYEDGNHTVSWPGSEDD